MRVRKTQEKVYNEASGRTTMMIGKAIRRALKVGTVLLASTAMLIPGTALAADGETADSTTVVDGNTSGQYAESLGDNDSTRYAGRVWNDKTVSANNMEFNMTSGVNGTVLKDGSDFLVTYSMLATSQQITQLPRVPVDVVFILDFSASMTWGVDSTSVSKEDGSDSRIKYMVDALNNTIDALKEDSDPSHPNRIGIAYFNRTGHELLSLTELSENNLKKVKDGKYLSLAFKGTNGEDDGEATVTCNIGVHTTSAKTDSKTNIQFGLHEGMSMLADEQTTTFEYDGKTYTRIPNIVLMSDGAPTTISLPTDVQGDGTDDKPQSGSWWGKLDRNEGKDGTEDSAGWGDNSNAWSANGMMPMLTAQYLKGEIDAHYASTPNLANADQARSSMYTIGFGINKQTPSMVELANMVLNPNGNWGNQTDNACKEIVDAWEQYVAGGRPVLEYPKPKTKEGKVEKGYYQATHPSSYDPNTEVPDYVDAYYPADDANALENAFKEITNAITETAKAPTKTTSDPVHSGYVTYTDVIGEYMHVDSVKTLIYADQRFDLQPEQSGSVSVSEDKKTTTYVFNGSVDSPVYGSHNVNEIAITVTTGENGQETLTVSIPASVIPVRVNYVDVNADGAVSKNNNNGAMPLRLIYGVSLNNGVRDENGNINMETVSSDYIQNHSDGNGNVLFYANQYSGRGYSGNVPSNNGTTVGDANVTFTPAADNPFYFVQEDTPLYTGTTYDPVDQMLNDAQPATGEIDPNTTYYFPITFYKDEGKPAVEKWIGRTGKQLAGYTKTVGSDNHLELLKDAPRLGNLADLSRLKDPNATGTADQRLYPTFEANGNDPHNGLFRIYLGNNGYLKVPEVQPKTLSAESALTVVKHLRGKALSASEGDPNNFEFVVTPKDTTDGGSVTVSQAAAAEKLEPSTATGVDGTLRFRNDAAEMQSGTSTCTMHPITQGLTFKAADIGRTFTYEVSESVPEVPPVGYDYDDVRSHTVTYAVSVTNGELSVAVAVDGESAATPTVEFTNTYVAPVSSLPLTGGVLTPRNFAVAGVAVLLLAGLAWLLARRRLV